MADSTMANTETDDGENKPLASCPVLSAWQASPVVMSRLTQASLIQIPSKTLKFKRENLADNVDLLGPLINNLGSLAANCMVREQ